MKGETKKVSTKATQRQIVYVLSSEDVQRIGEMAELSFVAFLELCESRKVVFPNPSFGESSWIEKDWIDLKSKIMARWLSQERF